MSLPMITMATAVPMRTNVDVRMLTVYAHTPLTIPPRSPWRGWLKVTRVFREALAWPHGALQPQTHRAASPVYPAKAECIGHNVKVIRALESKLRPVGHTVVDSVDGDGAAVPGKRSLRSAGAARSAARFILETHWHIAG